MKNLQIKNLQIIAYKAFDFGLLYFVIQGNLMALNALKFVVCIGLVASIAGVITVTRMINAKKITVGSRYTKFNKDVGYYGGIIYSICLAALGMPLYATVEFVASLLFYLGKNDIDTYLDNSCGPEIIPVDDLLTAIVNHGHDLCVLSMDPEGERSTESEIIPYTPINDILYETASKIADVDPDFKTWLEQQK